MLEFPTWKNFRTFQHEVARSHRFIRSPASQLFLDTVVATSADRIRNAAKGTPLWRARLGHGWREERAIGVEVPCPLGVDEMKPLPDRAREGRVNPLGIPCLYSATNPQTALSEVRPWVGTLVSVAHLETTRDLRLVDCSKHHDALPFYLDEPPPSERANAVWALIDRAFAEPVTRTDDTAEYAATQILAERFRHEGFDGVVYKSAFGEDGFNVALFDLGSASVRSCALHKVTGATFESRVEHDPYYVRPEPLTGGSA